MARVTIYVPENVLKVIDTYARKRKISRGAAVSEMIFE